MSSVFIKNIIKMVKDFIDNLLDNWSDNWRALLVNLVLVLIIVLGIFSYLYSEQKEILHQGYIDKTDLLEKEYNLKLKSFDEQIKQKDAKIELIEQENKKIEKENIQNKINEGAININISNNNIQNLPSEIILNASCNEKDIIIAELSKKVNTQDRAITIYNEYNQTLSKELNDLKTQIPEYDKGFVGKDFKVYKGATYQADKGKFTLAVRNTYAYTSSDNYGTIFILNGIEYSRKLGQKLVFTYVDGYNYTLNLKATNNPATFYIYKNE